MIKPYGSILENISDKFRGSNPSKILPPSRGGSGNKLITNKRMLINIPKLQISLNKDGSVGYKISSVTYINDQKIA